MTRRNVLIPITVLNFVSNLNSLSTNNLGKGGSMQKASAHNIVTHHTHTTQKHNTPWPRDDSGTSGRYEYITWPHNGRGQRNHRIYYPLRHLHKGRWQALFLHALMRRTGATASSRRDNQLCTREAAHHRHTHTAALSGNHHHNMTYATTYLHPRRHTTRPSSWLDPPYGP